MSSEVTSIELRAVPETPVGYNQEANTLNVVQLPCFARGIDQNPKELDKIDDCEEIDGVMMIEYIHLKKFIEPLITYAGLFAGFEAFIINSYNDNNELSEYVKNGLFCMYLSFILNLMTVLSSLILMMGMSRGFVSCCMKFSIMIFCVYGVIGGIIFFGIAIMYYIWATKLSDTMKISLWILIGGVGLLSLILLIYIMIKIRTLEMRRKMSIARRLL